MGTYRFQIHGGNGYTSQECKVDGVNTQAAALRKARQLNPGANIKVASFCDTYDMARRQQHNDREAATKAWHNDINEQRKQRQYEIENSNPGGGASISNAPYHQDSVSSSSGNFDVVESLGFFPTVILGGGTLLLLSLFGGNVTQLKEMIPNTERMEYTQQNNTPTSNPFDNVTTYSNHHIDESIPEFFNTELQEEAITDLGQDWDN